MLIKLAQEDISSYNIVDYWDADITAVGLQKGNVLIYISAFDYNKTNHYSIIIEELETGKILKREEKTLYDSLVNSIQFFFN
ncbi:hypothetical protein [Chryseobacterium jejuense]|uniref:hypothetical protein n=1 Tax=Chryseobacterium jejuense TaxID=445960 RepID=UPI001AE8FDDB|nr:hypothetical protein [Chryseobacterium jejuense]MBP2617512.1 hypothetical protein [Chryseobacterium jejuense]